jgi:hypothetical protein
MRSTPFNNLSLDHKLLLIEDIGTPVFSMEYYDHRINLYEVNNMFVEEYFNIETKKIDRVDSISYADLDKYLSRITIDDLVKPEQKNNSARFYL